MGNFNTMNQLIDPIAIDQSLDPINIKSNIKLNELQIIIGSYLFTLISYDFNDIEGRGSVKIKSNSIIVDISIEEIFFVYKSKSELGFWRLCHYTNYHLLKGNYDYVQQTFIHLELQNFIDSNIYRIPYDNHNGCFYNNKKNYEKIQTFVNNNKRILNLNFNYPENMKKIWGLSKIPDIKLKECTEVPDINTIRYISKYLDDNYDVITINKKYNFNKFYFLERNIKLETVGNIYECILKNKNEINDNNYYNGDIYLYYLNYDIKIKNTSSISTLINKKNKFIPIIAIDTNYNKITKFGLYYNYIILYQYICKTLQYNIICKYSELYPSCSDDYCYIGDIYDNLHMTMILKSNKEQSESNKEQSESNKEQSESNDIYKLKYNKYKIKYLKLLKK
jgi:hypothetical protein